MDRQIMRRADATRRFAATGFSLVMVLVALAALVRPGSQLGLPASAAVRPVDEAWVLFAAALVFLMQAGFLAYEVGLARPVHASVVAMKNVVDWAISSLGFFLIGFSLMFGPGSSWWGSADLVALSDLSSVSTSVSGPTFFLFQLAFAGTAITLVSGSLAERTTVLAYAVIATAIAVVIYPVYGRWVWGDLLIEDNGAWLADLGFHDFAGGSVVHLLGATVALVGILMIGPRIGRFGVDGTVRALQESSIGLTLLGVLLLWFGWWGFNGGSHLALTDSVPGTILTTNLSGAAGLVGAGLTAYLLHGRYAMNTKLVGGAIGGLVAVTPGADVLTPLGALATGLIAGWIYAEGFDALLRRRVDDALGVIPAHGFCAIWGLVALALFAPAGTFEQGRGPQVLIQVFGALVCMVWAGALSWAVFALTRRLAGLRVSPEREMEGTDLEDGASGNGPWRRRPPMAPDVQRR